MLGELGDERAVEPLIEATRDPEHKVRLTAVWALDALQRSR
jgi:HEAT repeat protein